jgi:hypothetical protein
MRKIISLICVLLPIVSYADSPEIRENAPDRHVVVKGDTLWDIASTFFKDPWKWQEIWGLNKDTIKNPHWIYPGDIVLLDRSAGTLHVGESSQQTVALDTSAASTNATSSNNNLSTSKSNSNLNLNLNSNVVRLSPHSREISSEHNAIPTIPLSAIAPFLTKPLVVDDVDLSGAPKLVGTYEQRTLLATNDVAYVRNMPADKGTQWQVYRPGQTFFDPDTKENLGHEVIYLGDASVEKFAPISELRIIKAVLEIAKGDYFTQSTEAFASSFEPHAPASQISAKIISIYGGVNQAGQNAIITINKGARDGLENGHVLALYQKGEFIKGGTIFKSDNVVLPGVRYGLIFVFRTFQKVSYALVLQSRIPVQILDTAQTP